MAVATERPGVERSTGFKHYIDGGWADPQSDETVAVINPTTEERIAEVPRATPAEALRALEAARREFDEGRWRRLAPPDRALVIRQLAEGLERRSDEIADLLIRQGGCTFGQTRGMQCAAPIQWLHELADLVAADSRVDSATFSGGPLPGSPKRFGTTLAVREPIGVVSAITPFNYPFFLNLQKIAPSMAAGCGVVLKPTEYICLDAVVIAQVLDEETDLPAGVFNLLLGGKGDVGEILASHPLVDAVTFTGSTATGRRIMELAAPTVKKVMLELGGKSASIVLEDADLDRIQDAGLVIRHCGQGCGHWTRVLAHESRHDEVVERMLERAKTVVVGDPADPATEMGPLVSEAQRERVERYIEIGQEEGATLAAGGGRPAGLDKGWFMEPTVFTGVGNDMRIAQEEIFGPVVSVQPFSSEEEAIRLANDSIYGLNGAVWSADVARALRVAGEIRTGTVFVNGGGSGRQAPYGGYKQSGIGREFGVWGYHEYQELKAISYSV